MAQEAWRAYLELAYGMTEATTKRATKTVRRLVGKSGATAEQLQGMAEDLLKASTANRDALTKLVRYELDRALGAVGLATAEEVADLTSRVHELEAQLRVASMPSGAPAQPVGVEAVTATAHEAIPVGAEVVAKKTVAKRTAPAHEAIPVGAEVVAKRTVAKKTVKPVDPPPVKAVPRKSSGPAKKAAAKAAVEKIAQASHVTPATKSAGTKSAGTKSAGTAKKAPAKRRAGG